jgi:hypothetical protein
MAGYPYTRALALTFLDAASGETRRLTATAPPGEGGVRFADLVLDGGLSVGAWQRAHPQYRLLSFAPVGEAVRWGTQGQFLPPPLPEGGPRYRRPTRARRRRR